MIFIYFYFYFYLFWAPPPLPIDLEESGNPGSPYVIPFAGATPPRGSLARFDIAASIIMRFSIMVLQRCCLCKGGR